jgi:hypothetical protein
MKSYFQIIERSSETLDLIYLDISDLKFLQTRYKKSIILLL